MDSKVAENQLSIVIAGDVDPHCEMAMKIEQFHDLRRSPDLNELPGLCTDQPADVVIIAKVPPGQLDPSIVNNLRTQDQAQNRYTAVLQCVTAEQLQTPSTLLPGMDDYLLAPFDASVLALRLRSASRIALLETQLLQTVRPALDSETSLQDTLTGLGNWRYLIKHLEALILETRSRGGLSCCALLSVDHLDHIRERRGEAFRDEVLRVVAKRLREALRPADFLARTGEHEFGVAMRYADNSHNRPWIFERLLRTVNYPPLPVDLDQIVISVSVGMCCDEGSSETTPFDMLAKASQKMRDAQDAGGNTLIM